MRRVVPPLLAALCGVAAAAPDEETQRPWRGILPDPRQSFATDEEPGSEWFACRFLDALP